MLRLRSSLVVPVMALIALVVCAAGSLNAIVIDLSERDIEIRYSFNGADLILFGSVGAVDLAAGEDQFDIVVVVRGPEEPAVVRRKGRVGGVIWVNGESFSFPAAPGYYAVAANRALIDIADSPTYAASGIGFENLGLVMDGDLSADDRKAAFQDALFRIRTNQGLYRQEVDSVTLVGEGLFRTDIRLPANVPVGEFFVDAYVFVRGEMRAKDRIALTVNKAGFERAVYSFANQHPFFYGLVAVIIALLAGWLAGVIGKK